MHNITYHYLHIIVFLEKVHNFLDFGLCTLTVIMCMFESEKDSLKLVFNIIDHVVCNVRSKKYKLTYNFD